MATRCVHCGVTLKDGARFCNNCGMLVPPHPFSSQEEEAFDDAPTRPLATSSPDKLGSGNPHSVPSRQSQQTKLDDVERLDTVPLLARLDEPPTAGLTGHSAYAQARPAERSAPVSSRSAAPVRTAPTLVKASSASTAQAAKQASPLPHTPPRPSIATPQPRRSRRTLMIALLAIVMLVLVGSLGAWIVLFQPFSVPSITQPQQSFKDSALGISLLYPSSWSWQVDHSTATVHFYDSSHTGQINIVVGVGSSSANQSLQQQAGQLGMTAQKPGPTLTFAGTTWQQLQGHVQQKGASYTATLLVGMHNQRLYTLVFLAPQTIYAQEEQYVFAGMRSSFQFTS